jgi:hypothetical protein
MAFRDILPNRMQSDIAYGDYMNAEADINRLQGLNQNLAAYRDALQEAQKAKFVAGEQYLSAINASRANAGQAPFTGWPEEAMGGRRVLPAVDRMGYPLTPQEEAMYAQASPRRVVPLTPAELATSQPAVRPSVVDTNYSGSGADFGAEEPAQAASSRVVELNPEELAAFNARNNFAQGSVQQQQEAAPLYPEREHELRRQDLRAKVLATNKLMTSLIQRNDQSQSETIRSIFRDKIDKMVDAEQLKSFDESNAAKSVWAELPSLRKERDFVKTIREDILQAEKIQKDDPANKARLVISLQTILPKMIQSAASGGSDAVQMQEFMKLAPELVNGYAEYATSIGKDPLSSGTYFQWLNSSQFKKTADPEAFIQKVKEKYNVIASARNSVVEEFQNRTSPEWFSKTGVKELPLFKSDIESELNGKQSTKQMAAPSVQSLLEKYK